MLRPARATTVRFLVTRRPPAHLPARRLPFDIVYDPQVNEHLHAIERKYHSLIRRAIEGQLRFEPDCETQNRKPLLRTVEFDAAKVTLQFEVTTPVV